MSTMTWRGTLAWSIVLSAGWVGIEYALYDVTDPVEVAIMISSEVPAAVCIKTSLGTPTSGRMTTSAGTISTPPPMPKSADTNPIPAPAAASATYAVIKTSPWGSRFSC